MESRLDRFLRTRPLAALSAIIVLGTAAGLSAWESRWLFAIGGGVFALVAVCLCALKKPNRFAAWLCVLLFAAAGLSAWRTERPAMEPVYDADIAGVVQDMPEWQQEKGRTVFHLEDVTVNGEALSYDVRVYAYGEFVEAPTIADGVSMHANLYEPERNGNGTFDFQQYLWAEGVGQFVSMEAAEIAVTPQDGGIMERIADFREVLRSRVDELFPENAALLRGLILGDRTDIADEDEAAFSDAGIMHLLAVSGLHVSMLASALTMAGIALCVPKAVMLILVTALLIVYCVLCGGSPSIVRAVLMYLLMQSGGLWRRSSDSFTRLATACAVMVLFDPRYLWQTGFQLSFAAVAGITMLHPTLAKLYGRLPFASRGPGKWLLDAVSVSVSVQLSALPVLIGAFGEVSWVSLLLNIPSIPLAQAALMLGIAALLASFALPVGWLAGVADALTGALISLAHWGAELPFAVTQIPALKLPFLIGYVLCIAAGTAQFRTKQRSRVIAICLLPVLVFANAFLSDYSVANEDFQVTFLDVGQADAAIVNAGGALYMVDVGEDMTAANYIEERQLDIEGIFLSHAHDDHVGGLEAVLAVTDPEWIALPAGYMGGEADVIALNAIAVAENDGVPVRTLAAGDEIRLSNEITAEVLCPAADADLEGGNESSMLLRISYGEGSVLFTGDLPSSAEPMYIEPCSVLKVAHHGSAGSSSGWFLAQARPTLAVLSVGARNPYGHPAEALLERLNDVGCKVLRTDLHGAVTVNIDSGGNVRANTYFSE